MVGVSGLAVVALTAIPVVVAASAIAFPIALRCFVGVEFPAATWRITSTRCLLSTGSAGSVSATHVSSTAKVGHDTECTGPSIARIRQR